jgi:glucosyl-dolichyl phosphate glucuronosyltransferase
MFLGQFCIYFWPASAPISGKITDSVSFMNHQPLLSIVVCTFNRQKYIRACLDALAIQTLDPNQWEAIVIDNNSTDLTPNIIHSWMKENKDVPVRYVLETRKGLSNARNRGIYEARGEIVTYIDDDAESEPTFAEAILTFMLDNPDTAGIGGKVVPKYSEDPEPEWMSNFLYGYVGRVDHGPAVKLYNGGMKYPIGCNMTYRKELLKRAGGFNPELTSRGDDKYIFQRIVRINQKVIYLPDALVFHNIDGERLSKPAMRNLYMKTGYEEGLRMRCAKGMPGCLFKTAEFMSKFGVSILIWMAYALNNHELKGRYIMLSQWYTLCGILQLMAPKPAAMSPVLPQ